MFHTRFSHALHDGALSLPEDGRVLVIGPSVDHNLIDLPKDRVTIYSNQFPSFDMWSSRGFETCSTLPTSGYDVAIVCAPRAKGLALDWLHAASVATNQGLILLDGQKTDGMESLVKALKKQGASVEVLSKAHGKLAWFSGANFPDWAPSDITLEDGFVTHAGVFSADGIDKGSEALVMAMPAEINGRIADLGAGWGYLSHHILMRDGVKSLDLIEADLTALECARKNIPDARARFIWNDATTFRPDGPYDVVISNPPFHTGRTGTPELGRAFIRSAARILAPNGRFVMVANRHLPYEDTLAEQFKQVEELGGTPGFKLLMGSKPRRGKQ